ncbi:MAG: sigma 54-interacting transcriptional regulator [Gemmatales bacterium]|nr:sigma 54-interacting transcriptional regulator [Gemmatales bacterium]MDW8386225.1 sigma 54-interacting transcriptional regulator [Gemmatales bacterium]
MQDRDRAAYSLFAFAKDPMTPLDSHLETPLPEQLAQVRQRLRERYRLDRFIASDPAMMRVLDQARLAAAVPVPISLVGEVGTGRRHLIRCIHHLSAESDRPCVFLECSLLPEAHLERQLSEGQLLGPPDSASAGWGTLAIVDPAALPRELQQRLLAFLESKAPSDRRRLAVICDQPLTWLCQNQGLLPALAERLGVLVITLPPLRERPQDIPLLAQHALELCNLESDRRITTIQEAALDQFRAYSWPGNVGQLIEFVREAHRRAEGAELRVEDLPLVVRLAGQPNPPRRPLPLPLDALLEAVEMRLLRLAWEEAGGNASRAAARLGITPARLNRRLIHFGLRQPPNRDHSEADAAEG